MERTYKTVLINLAKKPLKAFATIYAYDLYKYQYVFLAIVGIAFTLNRQFYKLADIRNPFLPSFITDLGLGAIFGWMGVGIFSLLIYWSGSWIKGRATLHNTINIIAYASLVNILTVIAGLGCIVALRLLGYSGVNYRHVWGNTFYNINRSYFYFAIVINVLFLVLATLGISVAQGFSVPKAMLNILLAALMVIVPVAILISGI